MRRDKNKIVHYRASSLEIQPEVAKLLGLEDGHEIESYREMLLIVGANTRHCTDRVNLLQSLRETLKHTS